MFYSTLVFGCIVNRFVIAQNTEVPEAPQNGDRGIADDEYQDVQLDPLGDHTFVALLDIVFTDSSKRTCTGTIIHETVVLTAAHCFTSPENPSTAKPELLASFVVVGSKRMFKTGYEQYLPIEKILIHPKYEGWTADLAMVFTFAAMTGRKEGTVIGLLGERTSTHVDANVTVLSWGPLQTFSKDPESDDCNSDEDSGVKPRTKRFPRTTQPMYRIRYPMRTENEEIADAFMLRNGGKMTQQSVTSKVGTSKVPNTHRYHSSKDAEKPISVEIKFRSDSRITDKNIITEPAFIQNYREPNNETSESSEERENRNLRRFQQFLEKTKSRISSKKPISYPEVERPQAELKSIYVNAKQSHETKTKIHQHSRNSRGYDQSVNQGKSVYRRRQSPISQELDSYAIRNHYNDWRRQMGNEQNTLKVDVYGFVNQKTCENIVEKAMPAEFHIGQNLRRSNRKKAKIFKVILGNKNDVVCYSGDGHYVTDDDSGAPVVRQGRLIAVTVGGVKLDDVHVAVGMKMSCYCSWIADNMPDPKPEIICCYNCCDVTHLKDGAKPLLRYDSKKKIMSF